MHQGLFRANASNNPTSYVFLLRLHGHAPKYLVEGNGI
jgi:hypothetical protein